MLKFLFLLLIVFVSVFVVEMIAYAIIRAIKSRKGKGEKKNDNVEHV